MPKNPFTDVWQFLTGTTDDYLALGSWRYLIFAFFWALVIVSITVAFRNWKEDPQQRTGRHFGTCLARILIGCMWFEGMLWKLPLPAPGGLQYWTEQETTRAAFEAHGAFIKDFVLPHLAWFGPLVFLAELTFAASLILGLAVRTIGILCILFVLQLWLGIYRPGDPAEWPWTYIFLATLIFLFVIYAAGRSLGCDAWLRHHVASVRNGSSLWGRLLRISG
ncbi:MAG TPA: DoxX family protein [Xanthobacteraceae bacterium]|nr:DoxX family protein [Xanthobacteraceae bacterium]